MKKVLINTKFKSHLDQAFILIIVFGSFFVIMGWLLDIQFLKNVVFSSSSMKMSTAFFFFLSGISMCLIRESRSDKKDPREFIAVMLCVSVLVFVFLITLFAIVSGYPVSENEFNQVDLRTSEISSRLELFGIPSLGTIAGFILLQVALLTSLLLKNVDHKVSIFGRVLMVLGGISIIGHLSGVMFLTYRLPFWNTGMAIHSALFFVFIGIVLLDGKIR